MSIKQWATHIVIGLFLLAGAFILYFDAGFLCGDAYNRPCPDPVESFIWFIPGLITLLYPFCRLILKLVFKRG